MKKIKKYTEEYLKYSIGYTQIALSTDYPTFWIIIEFIAQIQRIAMVFLFEEVLHLLQKRRQITESWMSDYNAIKLVSKIFVPTIFMADMLSNNSIIALQIILTILLSSPLLTIAAFIQYEKSSFATIQFKSQVGGQENSTLSINLLNRSYNMSDFIENFLYQQLMGNDQRSWLNTMRTFLAKLLNTYPHICTIPLMYWNLLLVLFVIYDENMSNNQRLLMMILDIFTIGFMIVLWMFSMIAQRSYSMFDNNHLRIIQSTWFNISQVVKFMPIVVQFIYFLSSDPIFSLGIQNAITTIIQINILGDLFDFFYSIPYMYEYKQDISFLCLTSTLIISITHEFQLKQMELFSICLISIPLATKLIKQMFCFLLEILFDKQFFKEKERKKVVKQQVQRKSRILEEELSPFVIEKEMQELKQQQIEVLKNQHFRYFVHYLRYSSFLRLSDQQSFDKNSNIDLQKSQFLINIIILIKSHVDNCESVYCYCKGFRGEKRKVVNCEQKEMDMKIFGPITINNIYIQVELIERYMRHYTKYVFDIENNEESPNIFRLSQLLLYLCDSEECYQVMTLIQDYKQKNLKNHTLINEVALTLIVGLAKFKVLQKMKNNMAQSDIETGIKYKNYRITEIRRDQIINHIFKNIDSKYKFLKTLTEGKLNFTEFYELVETQVLNQEKMIDEIETFDKYSACRTSILIYMFFTLEVSYNFEKFVRLNSSLKTKNYKFFEYPTTSSNSVQLQGFKVLYLKTNLARHFINGQFFRGQIMDFSNNAPLMLGYEPREFKEHILTVHQLVTPNLAHFHDQLLEIFFLTNKPAVLRKRRPLLMQRKYKELIFCEMFLDLSFNITEDAFPIYCFLKQIVPYGKFENVKGHIIISDTFQIEGISTQCLEQLKIKITQYNQRSIEELVPKFQNYVKDLQVKYEEFQSQEILRKRQKSTNDKFDFQTFEQLLFHFQIEEEHITLTVQQEQSTNQDIYIANGVITMSIGNIHSKLYQAYLISLNKVTLAENQSSSQAFDIMKPTTSFASINPLRLDSIQGIVQVDSESGNISDQIYREHYVNDDQRDILDYQLPQLYSNFQTPQESSRIMLSNHIQHDNEEKCLKSYENPEKYRVCVEDIPQSSNSNNLKWKNKQYNRKKTITQQQDYFHEDQTKKQKLSDVELMNSGTENNLWNKQNEPSLHPSSDNSNNISILQKSQLYSKFSRINNTPKLIRIILGLGTINIIIIIIIASISQSNYNRYLDQNQELLYVFLPFTTSNYLRNSYLGLSLYCDKENTTYIKEVTDVVSSNLESHEQSLQTLFIKGIVSHAVSYQHVEIYEFYTKDMVNVSTWTEIFQIEMFLEVFKKFDSEDENSLEKSKEAIFVLLNSFFNHIEVYESTTSYFHESMMRNLDKNTLQQSYISLLTDVAEVFILSFYIISWICLLRLQKRILRSSEQIQILAIQNEKIRFYNILQQFKAASELNLYKYQFSLRNKIQMDKSTKSQLFSVKGGQNQKTEQIKQLHLQDDNKFGLSNFILFYPVIGIIIFCFYIQYICLQNYSQSSVLRDQQELFNLYINYCQEINELAYTDYVVQNRKQLEEIGIEDELLEEYKVQVEEAYGEFQEFDQQFKYGNLDQSTDILNKSVENLCLVVSNSLCSSIGQGRLTQGLLYSIQYYMDIIRDNLNNEYDEGKIRVMFRDDLLAINFIADSLEQIISSTQSIIWNDIEQLQIDTFDLYISFLILICFLYILEIIVVYKYVKVRFYRCRQLPYLLPPQSTYGEDSFQKSLQYIEKIYHNIVQ